MEPFLLHIQKLIPLIFIGLFVSCKSDPTSLDYEPQPPGTPGYWITYDAGTSDLPSNQVSQISISPTDVVWVALENQGLARYDGTNWVSITAANSVLPSNQILDLEVDQAGTVWAATPEGLARITGNSITVFHSQNTPLPDDNILALAVGASGAVWVSVEETLSNGQQRGVLGRFVNNAWTLFHTANSPLKQTEPFTSLFVATTGRLWAGYDQVGGLVSMLNETWTLYEQGHAGIFVPATAAFAEDKEHRIWAGIDQRKGISTGGIDPLLLRIDGINWRRENPDNGNGRVYKYLSGLATDSKGIVWAVADQDLARFDGTAWLIRSWTSSDFPKAELQDLAIDSQDRLWVASDKGIMVIE